MMVFYDMQGVGALMESGSMMAFCAKTVKRKLFCRAVSECYSCREIKRSTSGKSAGSPVGTGFWVLGMQYVSLLTVPLQPVHCLIHPGRQEETTKKQ